MVKRSSGKRKWSLVTAVAVIAVLIVVLALVINNELVTKHMYPQDTIHENSNVLVRGVVTSIEENYKTQGMVPWDYHIFRFFITLNITELVWISPKDFVHPSIFSPENKTINGWNVIGIGYDNLDKPQLSKGQIAECKGYYLPTTDSSYSFKITVAPSISESYLEPL